MDVDFDLAVCLKYILEIGDVDMEVESVEEKSDEHRKPCSYCPKTFKTKVTLERHYANFHGGESEEMEKRRELIRDVVLTCTKEVANDLCLDDTSRYQIHHYDVDHIQKSFYEEVGRIFRNLKRTGDAGEFYEDFFATITQNSGLYFPELPHPSCVTFALKLSDKLLAKSQPNFDAQAEHNPTDELSDKELGGLQYLAGYVIKNLIRKAKKWTKKCQPAVSVLLNEFLADQPRPDQLLISAKNRGGLSSVTEIGEGLFLEMEKRFRAIIRSKQLSGVNINDEADALVTDSKIVGHFTTGFTDQPSFNENVKTQALEMILNLYFLIRINSITRDMKHKTKGLRKTIKGPKESEHK